EKLATGECLAILSSPADPAEGNSEPDQRAPRRSRAGYRCSSDLVANRSEARPADDHGTSHWRTRKAGSMERQAGSHQEQTDRGGGGTREDEIGRASCRERVKRSVIGG